MTIIAKNSKTFLIFSKITIIITGKPLCFVTKETKRLQSICACHLKKVCTRYLHWLSLIRALIIREIVVLEDDSGRFRSWPRFVKWRPPLSLVVS